MCIIRTFPAAVAATAPPLEAPQRPCTLFLTPWKLEKDGDDVKIENPPPLVFVLLLFSLLAKFDDDEDEQRFSVALKVERAMAIFSSSKVMTAFCNENINNTLVVANSMN